MSQQQPPQVVIHNTIINGSRGRKRRRRGLAYWLLIGWWLELFLLPFRILRVFL